MLLRRQEPWPRFLPSQEHRDERNRYPAMKHLLLLAVLALPACAKSAPPLPDGPPLDPLAFFTGRSHGDATLAQIMKSDRSVTVESRGRMGKDGWLTLDQHILAQGDKPRDRSWKLRQAGPGHWTGTLTDAVGPVEAVTNGGGVLIRYTMKGGLTVEQTLMPIAGRRALDNHLYVTKLGLQLAHLHEIISKRQ